MTKMSFMPILKNFLRDHGVVYTVRKYKMVEKVVEVEGIGECRRIPLGSISKKEELLPYVELSGFDSVEAWWDKIRYFVPDVDSTLYLYKVELVPSQEVTGS